MVEIILILAWWLAIYLIIAEIESARKKFKYEITILEARISSTESIIEGMEEDLHEHISRSRN